MPNEYPKYVFKGQLLTMVKNKAEEEQLPGWTAAPGEDFCFCEDNHFQHLELVPEEHVRKFHEPSEDDEIIPGVTPKLDALPIAPTPEASPNPVAEKRAAAQEAKRLKINEKAKLAAEKKAAAALKKAAK